MNKRNTDKNKTTTLNIVQININKSYTYTSGLLKFCEDKNSDVICLQEPNIRGGHVRGLSKSIPTIYEATKPKTATIVINKNIRTLNLTEYNTEYITATELVLNDFSIYNINVYIPPERNSSSIFS